MADDLLFSFTQITVYSFIHSIAGSPSSSSFSSNLPNCSFPRESALVYATYLRSHLSLSQPKALRSKARGYLSELWPATCPEESTATGQDRVAYSMLKHIPRSGIDFLLPIFNLSFLCIPFLPSGRNLLLFPSTRWESSRLSCFLPASLFHLQCIKVF